jgi:hypothetical protein
VRRTAELSVLFQILVMLLHPLCATYVCTHQLQSLPENRVQVLVHVSHHFIVTVAIHCHGHHGELRVINRPTYTLYQNKRVTQWKYASYSISDPNALTEMNLAKWFVQYPFNRSRDSVLGIAIDYRLNDWGVGVWAWVGSRIFYFPRRPDRFWGPHSLWYLLLESWLVSSE